MRVLLIQPPHIYPYGIRMPDCFPLNLGYIASIIRKKHDVEVFDIWGNELPETDVKEKIKKIDYDVVGITALSTQFNYIRWLANEIKKYNKAKIIVGGALAIHSSDILLKNTKVDITVIGEGELTIQDLLENHDNLKEVKGIAFRKNKKIIKTSPREYIKDLDTIPFPAWELFPTEKYINMSVFRDDGRKIQMITGRGCPYNCIFCSKNFKGVRLRSVGNIKKEIKELKKRYGIRFIEFVDELVIVSKKRGYKLCGTLEKLNVRWSCQGRLNIVDYPLLKTMKKAGCKRIGYGIESGSQRILNIMNKQVDVKQAEKTILDTERAGLAMHPQMIFGMLGEDRGSLKETIDFCKRTHISLHGMFTATPLPGSWLYDYCIKNGMIKDELKYIKGLTGTDILYVNLTEFPDEEFDRIKTETVNEITRNYARYRRSHPVLFLKDYSYKMKRAYYYINDFGIRKFIKSMINALRKNPNIFFCKEIT